MYMERHSLSNVKLIIVIITCKALVPETSSLENKARISSATSQTHTRKSHKKLRRKSTAAELELSLALLGAVAVNNYNVYKRNKVLETGTPDGLLLLRRENKYVLWEWSIQLR